MPKPIRSILLVRPDGIGDQILCLPVASALRRHDPLLRIGFLSSVYAAPLLEQHPDVDEVIPCNHDQAGPDELRDVFGRYDAALFLKPYKHLFRAAWKAGTPVRIGTGFRWYSLFLNARVYKHRKTFDRHEAQSNLELLEGIGITQKELIPPRLYLTEPESRDAAALLPGAAAPRVVVHCGGFSPRAWLPEHFRRLVVLLAAAGSRVILTGSAEEGQRVFGDDRFLSCADVSDLTGTLTLRQVMAVIAASDLVVSLSTGPMHIAAAFGIPTVSIFDPRRSSSPARWKPLGRGVILMPDVPVCEKCSFEQCRWWDCMARVAPEAAADMVAAVLSGVRGQQGVEEIRVS